MLSRLARWYGRDVARLAVPGAGIAALAAFVAAWMLEVRARAVAGFQESESWSDLDGRHDTHGLRLERRGREAVVTDGEREARLSSVSRAVSRRRSESRLGPAPWKGGPNGGGRPEPGPGRAGIHRVPECSRASATDAGPWTPS